MLDPAVKEARPARKSPDPPPSPPPASEFEASLYMVYTGQRKKQRDRRDIFTFLSFSTFIITPFLANYPLMTVITVISESILRKTFILKFLRIPHTHGVFRHFSTSLRRVPRRWRGPTADRATSRVRSACPKVLEPVHFGAKNHRRNRYLTLHILVLFFPHSNGRPEHDLGLRFVGIQI